MNTHWKAITTQQDIDDLMEAYGGFHDSCIVSMQYQSGAFVDDRQCMHFRDAQSCALLIHFHSQWHKAQLQLLFTGLRKVVLTGLQTGYSSEILGVHLSFQKLVLNKEPESVIVWADDDSFDIHQPVSPCKEPADTFIIANALTWRLVDK